MIHPQEPGLRAEVKFNWALAVEQHHEIPRVALHVVGADEYSVLSLAWGEYSQPHTVFQIRC